MVRAWIWGMGNNDHAPQIITSPNFNGKSKIFSLISICRSGFENWKKLPELLMMSTVKPFIQYIVSNRSMFRISELFCFVYYFWMNYMTPGPGLSEAGAIEPGPNLMIKRNNNFLKLDSVAGKNSKNFFPNLL